MDSRFALLIALASPVLAATAHGTAATSCPSAPQERRSLESVLEDVDRELARRMGELLPEIVEIMDQLDALPSGSVTATSIARGRALEALGPDAVPLIVPFLDPGEHPKPAWSLRSKVAAEIVANNPTPAATDGIVRVLEQGSNIGMLRALTALRTTVEPSRVFEAVRKVARGEAFEESAAAHEKERAAILEEKLAEEVADLLEKIRNGEAAETPSSEEGDEGSESGDSLAWTPSPDQLQSAAFTTIAHFGTEEARAYMRGELLGDDQARRDLALSALASAPSVGPVSGLVRELLQSSKAPAIAGALAGFYGSNEALLEDDDHAEPLFAVALAEGVSPEARVRLFDLFRLTDTDIKSSAKRDLERTFGDAAHATVRRAALLLLAREGDRGAKRELLSTFDDRLESGRNIAQILAERAALHHEIGDWKDAVKDWRDAMEAQSHGNSFRKLEGAFLGIARSLARQGKFRDALEYLEKSPLSIVQRKRLATDRDFREMAQSDLARRAFQLD